MQPVVICSLLTKSEQRGVTEGAGWNQHSSFFSSLFLSPGQVDKGKNKARTWVITRSKWAPLPVLGQICSAGKGTLGERKLHFSQYKSSYLIPAKFPWKLQGHPALFIKGNCRGFRFVLGSYRAIQALQQDRDNKCSKSCAPLPQAWKSIQSVAFLHGMAAASLLKDAERKELITEVLAAKTLLGSNIVSQDPDKTWIILKISIYFLICTFFPSKF